MLEVQRFYLVGGSNRALKGGSGEVIRGSKSRSSMLNRSRCTGDGQTWNTLSEIMLEKAEVGRGVRIFWRGFAKRGVRANPPDPPGYGPDLCFIDYTKAFDKLRHEEIMSIFDSLNIDGKDLRIVRNIYWEQTAAMRIGNDLSAFQYIKRFRFRFRFSLFSPWAKINTYMCIHK